MFSPNIALSPNSYPNRSNDAWVSFTIVVQSPDNELCLLMGPVYSYFIMFTNIMFISSSKSMYAFVMNTRYV